MLTILEIIVISIQTVSIKSKVKLANYEFKVADCLLVKENKYSQ